MPKPNVREQIVATGLHLLHGKGFNATSVQDITEAAGVPKGSFYNHFASKEVLGAEVMQRYAEQAGQLQANLLDGDGAPLKRLRRYFTRLIELNAESNFACGCLLGNFSTELSAQSDLIREQVDLSFAHWYARLAEVIAEAQQDGSVADEVPARELAAFIVHAWQGAVLRSKSARNRAPLDLFLKLTLSRILR